MRAIIHRISLISMSAWFAASLIADAGIVIAQQRPKLERRTPPTEVARPQTTPAPRTKTQPATEPTQNPAGDTIKIDTDVITVPVVASDRANTYVYDLRREEFTIYEDGVKQELAFFGAVREPFHVVLMLDTSLSTQQKLTQIRRAAHEFIEQLHGGDRVKIISFDDAVKDWGDFTGNRSELRRMINEVNSGKGTKLYDAIKLALNSLQRVKVNRKAIVILTDGVDWHSDSSTFDGTLTMLEEAGVITYPIRYDTRHEVEAMLRNQRGADLATIFGGTSGPTTPPTMPGETRVPNRTPGGNDPYQIPIPPVIIGSRNPDRYPGGGGRYPDDRNPVPQRPPDDRNPETRVPDNRYPDNRRYPDDRYPDNRYPDNRYPDSRDPRNRRYPDDRSTDPRYPDPRSSDPLPRRQPADSTAVTLDHAYRTADDYLNRLADKSGGELYRADTLADLPDAFAKIAAELRNQYALGYYPTNAARDGKYRKIKVTVARKDVVIRARPGYRALATERAGK
jgi:Mg-chelatase subunit ChlD